MKIYYIFLSLFLVSCTTTSPMANALLPYTHKNPAFILAPDCEKRILALTSGKYIADIHTMVFLQKDLDIVGILVSVRTKPGAREGLYHQDFVLTKKPTETWSNCKIHFTRDGVNIQDLPQMTQDEIEAGIYDAEDWIKHQKIEASNKSAHPSSQGSQGGR